MPDPGVHLGTGFTVPPSLGWGFNLPALRAASARALKRVSLQSTCASPTARHGAATRPAGHPPRLRPKPIVPSYPPPDQRSARPSASDCCGRRQRLQGSTPSDCQAAVRAESHGHHPFSVYHLAWQNISFASFLNERIHRPRCPCVGPVSRSQIPSTKASSSNRCCEAHLPASAS